MPLQSDGKLNAIAKTCFLTDTLGGETAILSFTVEDEFYRIEITRNQLEGLVLDGINIVLRR